MRLICCRMALVALAAIAMTPKSHASVVVILQEVGPDVVAIGNGTLDLTDLTFFVGPTNVPAQMTPSSHIIHLGAGFTDYYNGAFAGPGSFGTGSTEFASSSSGPHIGYEGLLTAPAGYISGVPIVNAESLWSNQSFTTLGVDLGTYVWSWGSGLHADSFELDVVPTATPEPSTGLLLFAALTIGLGARRKFAAKLGYPS